MSSYKVISSDKEKNQFFQWMDKKLDNFKIIDMTVYMAVLPHGIEYLYFSRYQSEKFQYCDIIVGCHRFWKIFNGCLDRKKVGKHCFRSFEMTLTVPLKSVWNQFASYKNTCCLVIDCLASCLRFHTQPLCHSSSVIVSCLGQTGFLYPVFLCVLCHDEQWRLMKAFALWGDWKMWRVKQRLMYVWGVLSGTHSWSQALALLWLYLVFHWLSSPV